MDHLPAISFKPKVSQSSFSFAQGGVLHSDNIHWHVCEFVTWKCGTDNVPGKLPPLKAQRV